jgi:hypothetical protein
MTFKERFFLWLNNPGSLFCRIATRSFRWSRHNLRLKMIFSVHSADEYVRLGGDVLSNTAEGYFAILKRGIKGKRLTYRQPNLEIMA